jgi:hypothetical protein
MRSRVPSQALQMKQTKTSYRKANIRDNSLDRARSGLSEGKREGKVT